MGLSIQIYDVIKKSWSWGIHLYIMKVRKAGLEIGKTISCISSLEMIIWVKPGQNFATAMEILVTRATMLVAFATVLVAVLSQVSTLFENTGVFNAEKCKGEKCWIRNRDEVFHYSWISLIGFWKNPAQVLKLDKQVDTFF